MAEAKSIVTYQTREYGVVKVKLAALMDRRGITPEPAADADGHQIRRDRPLL